MSDHHQPIEAHYWGGLAEYIGHFCALFGLPAALAQALWISRAEHKRLTDFLRILEQILRRLLFIDALALTPEPVRAPERKRRVRREMPLSFGASFDDANSESWRVSFQLNVHPHRALPIGADASVSPIARRRAAAPAPDRISTAPSARRLEALIRAYNNRAQLARNLARRLARDARAALGYIAPTDPKQAHIAGHITLTALTAHVLAVYDAHRARLLNSS